MCVCLRVRDIDGAVGVASASAERVAPCEGAVRLAHRERGQSQRVKQQLLRLVMKSSACALDVQVLDKVFKSPE